MTKDELALFSILRSDSFPYDAPDEWWNSTGDVPAPPPINWAHRAARAIMHDLQERAGINNNFPNVDEATRVEIVSALATIIRVAVRRAPFR
ncbi:MAG: hypothetical protein RJB58_42 [Pseudomonadota bacterium]|jgi:hypothetical protein